MQQKGIGGVRFFLATVVIASVLVSSLAFASAFSLGDWWGSLLGSSISGKAVDVSGNYVCAPGQKIGDVDGDGSITGMDADNLSDYVLGNKPMPADICCFDADQSGSVSSLDKAIIRRIAQGYQQSPGNCPIGILGVCGNGKKEGIEACDDGNTASGDGCSSDCAVEAVTPTCTDSDVTSVYPDGKNYLVRGTTAMSATNSTLDRCERGHLYEYYCASGNRWYDYVAKNCSETYSSVYQCIEGACVVVMTNTTASNNVTESCFDSDWGYPESIRSQVKGAITVRNVSHQVVTIPDQCTSTFPSSSGEHSVREYRCVGNQGTYDSVRCEGSCLNGQCVPRVSDNYQYRMAEVTNIGVVDATATVSLRDLASSDTLAIPLDSFDEQYFKSPPVSLFGVPGYFFTLDKNTTTLLSIFASDGQLVSLAHKGSFVSLLNGTHGANLSSSGGGGGGGNSYVIQENIGPYVFVSSESFSDNYSLGMLKNPAASARYDLTLPSSVSRVYVNVLEFIAPVSFVNFNRTSLSLLGSFGRGEGLKVENGPIRDILSSYKNLGLEGSSVFIVSNKDESFSQFTWLSGTKFVRIYFENYDNVGNGDKSVLQLLVPYLEKYPSTLIVPEASGGGGGGGGNTTTLKCDNGCSLDGKCQPFGSRKGVNYCSVDALAFVPQKSANDVCENHYECNSNFCSSGKCVDAGFIQRIVEWFKRLFGSA